MNYATITYWSGPQAEITFTHRLSWWRWLLAMRPRVERYTRDPNACWRDDQGQPASREALRRVRAEVLRIHAKHWGAA